MTTTIYDIEELGYGTTGWNGILESFIQKFEAYVFTRILVTVGESVVKGNPLYLDPTNKRWYKAQADGVKQPARCIALESGDSGDTIRAQRVGTLTVTDNLQIGRSVWLDPDTAGAITQIDQYYDPNGQCLGWGHVVDGGGESTTNTLFVDIRDVCGIGPRYTSTTTTSSTSTTSSTASSTSSSSSSSTSSTASSTSSTSSSTSSTSSSTSSSSTSTSSTTA